MTVYADMLFLINLYVDALLLALTRRFLRLSMPARRWVLASLLGGAFGFTALLPRLPAPALVLLGAAESVLLALVAFAPVPPVTLAKAAFSLFLFAASLSGLLLLLPAGGPLVRNGAVYYPLSAPVLLIATCAAYLVLRLFARLSGERAPDALFAPLSVTLHGKTVTVPARLDTGLSLREPFSGLPVIIAERRALEKLLPPEFLTFAPKEAVEQTGKTHIQKQNMSFSQPKNAPKPDVEQTKKADFSQRPASCAQPKTAPKLDVERTPKIRIVPFSSIGGEGLLPAFQPDDVRIDGMQVACWVALRDRPLSAGQYAAIFGPNLTPGGDSPRRKAGKNKDLRRHTR